MNLKIKEIIYNKESPALCGALPNLKTNFLKLRKNYLINHMDHPISAMYV